MLTYYEERRREKASVYVVKSWYLFGVLVYRTWTQLTTIMPTPSERE